jgi:hypothetical protein
VFGLWALSVFVYDRLNYWKVRAGQITHETVGGRGRAQLRHPRRSDVLVISTTGAKPKTVSVPNVLFLTRKVRQIQHLIGMKPSGSSA